MNTREFIAQAAEQHGNKYDYSKVVYTKRKGKVDIICKKHGITFSQIAGNHLNGAGCPLCGKERQQKTADRKARMREAFLEEANEMHDNKFMYKNLPANIKTLDRITIVCPEHGEFRQQVKVHLNGHGCPRCAVVEGAQARTVDTDEAMRRFTERHLTLEFRSVYKGMHSPLTAYCPRHDYEFTRNAMHFMMRGCPKCGMGNTKDNYKHGLESIHDHNESKRLQGKQRFAKWLKEEYIGKLTVDLDTYTKQAEPIEATCPIHGKVHVIPKNMMQGHGCTQCGYIEGGRQIRLFDDFVREAKSKFKNFVYRESSYAGMNVPMWIKCPVHGWRSMTPKNHLYYMMGRNKCNSNTSRYEEELEALVGSLGLKVERNVHNVLPIMYGGVSEIDVYIPGKKIGIEFHGLYWHTTAPHLELSKTRKMTLTADEQDDCLRRARYKCLDKYERALVADVRLVQIFQDEWIRKPDAVKNRLMSILGVAPKLYARKLTVVEATTPEQLNAIREFIERVHTQGDRPAPICFALVDEEGDVEMAATFGKAQHHAEYELVRLASDGNVIGGFSRLLSAFVKVYKPKSLMSYCDLRYGTGAGYEAVGFELVGMTEPDWWWLESTTSNHRTARQATTKARMHLYPHLYEAVLANPNKSIQQVAYGLGWRKIYGTGSKIYRLQFSH